ncbi:MAG: carbohydrate kinase [Ardenticatenaceae bacterium]|nr:carbohydrate kinase [Ardenticatenaceae bacterium]
MSKSFLLGIDQGSSGSRALILDEAGTVQGYAYRPLGRLHPRPDWVEQDPAEVAEGVAAVITEAIGEAKIHPNQIAACGITCQRNTDFVWDARNGRSLSNAISWQDLRTREIVEEVERSPFGAEARRRLGYAPGTYMTSLHLKWRMQHDTAVREAAQAGHLRIGQSALWLVKALGQANGHAMDTSMVQATGLYDFRAEQYWQEWLDWLGVPLDTLPEATPTLHPFGEIEITGPGGETAVVPVTAMIGDQQSALFGHGCHQSGDAEATFGTAAYVKLFLGDTLPEQENINVYYAWHLGDQQTYCLEAPTTVIGAAIRWMRDNARFLDEYADVERLATAVPDSGGVMFVPAFTGLDTPYNNPHARAALLGMTLGTERGHIVRAFLEALGYQLRVIKETMARDAGVTMSQMLVGGGVSASDIACQIQADMLNIPILRPTFTETTAWAAALLAGLQSGIWPDLASLPPLPGSHQQFDPRPMAERDLDEGYGRWQQAIRLIQSWQ